MEFLAVLVILSALVMFVTAPLRRAAIQAPAPESADDTAAAATIVELEAAREAKYREIRDAELDHRTGKLSDADFGELDAALRAEAVAILGALDEAEPSSPPRPA